MRMGHKTYIAKHWDPVESHEAFNVQLENFDLCLRRWDL